ncbi:hypothetical protein JCM17823_26450 [Halorubrum gandharaense]
MNVFDALRDPSHTGENRCRPCTVVNLAFVAIGTILVGIAVLPAAPVVLSVGLLAVYFRGYVVPGTPRFAPRLVAALPVDLGFAAAKQGPQPERSDSLGGGVDPERLIADLSTAGVLVEASGDLRLADDFREAFERRCEALRGLDEDALAARAAAAAPGDPESDAANDRILIAGDRDVWLSPAVAIAETAAVETLTDWDLDPDIRRAAARPLRTFVRICPTCGGNVRETTLRNCCGGPGSVTQNPERAVLACEACDAVVFEFEE